MDFLFYQDLAALLGRRQDSDKMRLVEHYRAWQRILPPPDPKNLM
jgi:hypothetical protein